MDLPFRLLQEELIPCYTKMGGATVVGLYLGFLETSYNSQMMIPVFNIGICTFCLERQCSTLSERYICTMVRHYLHHA